MTSKKSTYPSPAHAEADRLLGELAQAVADHDRLARQAEEALRTYRQEWEERLEPFRERLDRLDSDLRGLERREKETFFGEADSSRVSLPEGCLVYERTTPVIKRRAVTPEALEAQGFPEAVKIAKSVDWDLLETWPDERLWLVGTERRVRETYGYEIIAPQAGTPAPPEEAADGSGGTLSQGPG